MDPAGIGTWLGVSVVLALVGIGVGGVLGTDPLRAALYVVPAAFLATFMGSESFTTMSSWGPDIDSYFVLPSIIFGVFIVWLAGLAAAAPEPSEEKAP